MPNGNFRLAPPALVILSGLPGTGKTTFAAHLAERLHIVHLESDAIRRGISAQPTYRPGESAAVFARAEQLAAEALARGKNVVVDATNLSNRDRKRFLRLASRVGAKLVAVRVTAPDAVVRERLRQPRNGNSQAGLEVYEMMRGRPQPFRVPVIVADTRFPLEPAVDLVLRLINDQEL